MSVEDNIARVMSDLHKGRIEPTLSKNKPPDVQAKLIHKALDMVDRGPVINVTKLFKEIIKHKKSSLMYEDHECLFLPWTFAQFAWQNNYNNIYVISSVMSSQRDEVQRYQDDWETAEPIDWEDVKHVVLSVLWSGGRSSDGVPMRTKGPIMIWRFALDEDGKPLDINWVDVSGMNYKGFQLEQEIHKLDEIYPAGTEVDKVLEAAHRESVDGAREINNIASTIWSRVADNALVTLLEAITFLNCRNVDIVEPRRPRAFQRRLDRFGVKIHTIVVFPVGKTVRRPTLKETEESEGTALTTVRGHFARYGPKYGRKLLFGRYEGKFWIQSYARGSADHGISIANYELDPDGN